MNQKKIGVKNFRVFKEYTDFELRPITLLTGPNNSGKSSLTKLLLLLQNNLENLNFDEGKHNLRDFESILNWDSGSRNLKLRFENNLEFLPPEFKTQYEFNNGDLVSVSLLSDECTLFDIGFKTELDFTQERVNFGSIQRVQINFAGLIDLLKSKRMFIKTIETEKINEIDSQLYDKFISLKEFEANQNHLNSSNFSTLIKYIDQANIWEHEKVYHHRNSALLNEINNLSRNSLIFDILINGNFPDDENLSKILNIQDEVFSEILIVKNLGMSLRFKNLKMNLEHLIQEIPGKIENNFRDKLNDIYGEQNVSVEKNKLYKFLFEHKLYKNSFDKFDESPFSEDFYESPVFYESFLEHLQNISFNFKSILGNFDFISPNRGSQRRVLMNKSDYEIDEIVLEYSRLAEYNQKLMFLQKVLNILGIDGELKVQRYENYISVIYLIQNGKEITLSDLGFGYSQIIPIILKIIITQNKSFDDQFLIIEEPEANLHPNLQSKLAEVFALCLKEFPKLNLIIETHSEYLIRKLQYLTAKQKLSPKQSVIYYFNADKYVSREEPKVKKIDITPNGNLTDTFGPGFYDEATRLQFDLMKINQEQNN